MKHMKIRLCNQGRNSKHSDKMGLKYFPEIDDEPQWQRTPKRSKFAYLSDWDWDDEEPVTSTNPGSSGQKSTHARSIVKSAISFAKKGLEFLKPTTSMKADVGNDNGGMAMGGKDVGAQQDSCKKRRAASLDEKRAKREREHQYMGRQTIVTVWPLLDWDAVLGSTEGVMQKSCWVLKAKARMARDSVASSRRAGRPWLSRGLASQTPAVIPVLHPVWKKKMQIHPEPASDDLEQSPHDSNHARGTRRRSTGEAAVQNPSMSERNGGLMLGDPCARDGKGVRQRKGGLKYTKFIQKL
ncbi:uncharacterized protein MYCFIDRAFT_172348 [Pseudocercospora fijiensis CIRAD86]|uniref:Uncharacterized protein n=1 Tax=Pseudocercospora fijiensis (strain CIRAD86) TaxID=383855 RepID=M2Z9W2_PSEFD|nr:uncharacterized protein MYCFIDRAFT_172348 [Pseudocercospora fijiensis CIRAD86]EME86635.1 hypothetical protein MYCFIDRAFT_172348 [Pseudocercospora fijiensis CIRAD86]